MNVCIYVCECKLSCFSCIWLFETLWTVAHQALQSMGFSRQDTGVGCHFLLHGIFLTQGANLCLGHCRQIFYHWAIGEAWYKYVCRYNSIAKNFFSFFDKSHNSSSHYLRTKPPEWQTREISNMKFREIQSNVLIPKIWGYGRVPLQG